MTTTNPNTTDYGMFTEEGNVAVHEIVVNAVDVPSALEELVQLASIGLGPGWRHPMGEATDTEVFDAVAYAVEERLKGAPKLTLSAVIFDLEKQKYKAYQAAKVPRTSEAALEVPIPPLNGEHRLGSQGHGLASIIQNLNVLTQHLDHQIGTSCSNIRHKKRECNGEPDQKSTIGMV